MNQIGVSPTPIFALQIWGFQKKRQVKELSECRTTVIWSLDWVPSSYPYTEREKNVKKKKILLHLPTYWLHTGNSVSLLSNPVLSHLLRRQCNFPQAFSHHTPSAYTPLFDLSSTGLSQVAKFPLNFIFKNIKSQDTQLSLSEVFRTWSIKCTLSLAPGEQTFSFHLIVVCGHEVEYMKVSLLPDQGPLAVT